MIAAVEFPGAAPPPFMFRGKDSQYWKKEIFRELKTLDPAGLSPADIDKFRFIMVFTPGAFLEISIPGTAGIISFLKETDGTETNWSLKGTPFYALPAATFKALDFTAGETHLEEQLKTLEIQEIPLDNPYNTLDTRSEFRRVENAVVDIQLASLLRGGVTVEDFNHFYMEGLIPIGEGTRIGTGVVIKGNSRIGKNVTLYPNTYIEDSTIGDDCVVLPGCIVRASELERNVQIGPYTHLRGDNLLKEGSKAGNFVEMKKSTLGKGSKSMHLTYIGDSEIGEKVNIGAGTITCNYDGVNKHKTIIEDNAFIGSGTELVAPIVVRKGGYTAAGSTITEEVPEDSLAVSRGKQRNIIDWVKRKKQKNQLKKCGV